MTLCFLFGMIGLLSWSIRGQLGGWTGGFAAGLLLSSFLYILKTKFQRKLNAVGILFGALGFMWGGEISYGREFDLLADSQLNSAQLLIILSKIACFGAAWGAIGGFGIGHLAKKDLSKSNWGVFLLMNLIWCVTLWSGYGRYIWISFLVTTLPIWFLMKGCSELRCLGVSSGLLAASGAFGFAISGLALKYQFTLRDQIIGLCFGFGCFLVYRNFTSGQTITHWQFDQQKDISFLSLISGLTALAIAKEAIPLWPHKWEWSYTLMMIACGIISAAIIWKRITSDKPSA